METPYPPDGGPEGSPPGLKRLFFYAVEGNLEKCNFSFVNRITPNFISTLTDANSCILPNLVQFRSAIQAVAVSKVPMEKCIRAFFKTKYLKNY